MEISKEELENMVRRAVSQYISKDEGREKMKALIMNENREMVVEDMPVPIPSENNMIVKIKYASICGTDFRTFRQGSS